MARAATAWPTNSGDSELLKSSHCAASMTFSVRTMPRVQGHHSHAVTRQLGGHVGRHLVGCGFGHAVGDIADVLLCRPMGDCADQSAPLRNHPRCGHWLA